MRSAILILTLLLAVNDTNAQDWCGSERWSIKALLDTDTSLIRWDSVVQTSVTSLASLPRVSVSRTTPRLPEERIVYSIDAIVTDYKKEEDQDVHIVVKDPTSDSTMVVELPSTECPEIAVTPHANKYDSSLAWIKSNIGNPTTSFKEANRPVRIVGVLFRDRYHGQRGMAANAVELHPILSIGEATPMRVHEETLSASLKVARLDARRLRFTFEGPSQSLTMRYALTDLLGHQVLEGHLPLGITQSFVDLPTGLSGTYFFTIEFEQGRLSHKLILDTR